MSVIWDSMEGFFFFSLSECDIFKSNSSLGELTIENLIIKFEPIFVS
jgi:hypothetical protein